MHWLSQAPIREALRNSLLVKKAESYPSIEICSPDPDGGAGSFARSWDDVSKRRYCHTIAILSLLVTGIHFANEAYASASDKYNIVQLIVIDEPALHFAKPCPCK